MSLALGNNTPTRPRIEPGSPDPEFDALTTRPVRSPKISVGNVICEGVYRNEWSDTFHMHYKRDVTAVLFQGPQVI